MRQQLNRIISDKKSIGMIIFMLVIPILDIVQIYYQDIIKIYNLGLNADKNPDFHTELWDLDKIFVEDLIDESGNDWNFEKHQVINTIPSEADFMKSVSDYLSWEINQLICGGRTYDYF